MKTLSLLGPILIIKACAPCFLWNSAYPNLPHSGFTAASRITLICEMSPSLPQQLLRVPLRF